MEEITTKLKENESLIQEAKSYLITDNKGVEIAKDRIRFLMMLLATIEPIRKQANDTHKATTGYINIISKAIEGYEKSIGIFFEILKKEAKKQEQEINAILGPDELPVLVNTDIPDDIKNTEDIEIEVIDAMAILQGIIDKRYPLNFVDLNLAKIKKWIKEGKEIKEVEIKKIVKYKFKDKKIDKGGK